MKEPEVVTDDRVAYEHTAVTAACAGPKLSVETEGCHEVPRLAEELLATDRYWESMSQFSLRA